MASPGKASPRKGHHYDGLESTSSASFKPLPAGQREPAKPKTSNLVSGTYSPEDLVTTQATSYKPHAESGKRESAKPKQDASLGQHYEDVESTAASSFKPLPAGQREPAKPKTSNLVSGTYSPEDLVTTQATSYKPHAESGKRESAKPKQDASLGQHYEDMESTAASSFKPLPAGQREPAKPRASNLGLDGKAEPGDYKSVASASYVPHDTAGARRDLVAPRPSEIGLSGSGPTETSNASEAFKGHWGVTPDAPIKGKTSVSHSGAPFSGTTTYQEDYVHRPDPEGPRKPIGKREDEFQLGWEPPQSN